MTMNVGHVVAWGLAACLCLHGGAASANVLITELTPNGTAVAAPGKGVAFLAEIRNGQTFELPAAARAVAVDLASGREYVASGPGTFRVEESGVRALAGGQVTVRALAVNTLPDVKVVVARVSQAALHLRSLTFKPLSILSPANTAVLTPTPTLSWSTVEPAVSYKVHLRDDAGQTLFSTQTKDSSVAVPASARLESGRSYLWTVEALDEDGALPGSSSNAQFTVIAPQTAQLLQRIAPAANASFSDRVLYAAQLQEAGALEDARAVWKALSHERPDDPVLRKLAR